MVSSNRWCAEGHVEEDHVRRGQVREFDRDENNRAFEASDFGGRRVGPHIFDARRNLSGVCGRWHLAVRDLHRFFIVTSRAVVNDNDAAGAAPHALVWSAGGPPKRHRVVHAVRGTVLLPGPPPIWDFGWVGVFPTSVIAEDVCQWPYSVGVLVKLAAFLSTLHWPDSGANFGAGGVSFFF